MKKIVLPFLILLMIATTLVGCTYKRENYAFGTYYSLTIDGKNASKSVGNIEILLNELDLSLSTNIEDSYVSRINNAKANEPIAVTKDTLEIFKISQELYYKTNKAFNPAIYPLTELWNFSPSTYTGVETTIPSTEEVLTVLPYCNLEQFIINEQDWTITKLNDNAKIDFGAIAKGFAADKSYELAKDASSIVLDIGRTYRVKGDISLFVANPREGDFVAKATLSNQSVATSGDYERYYIYNSKRYHHIIDRSGYPTGIYENDPIISATIVGESATICDALSTATMILGYEESKAILDDLVYSALLLTEKGYYTIGEDLFEILDKTRQKLN